MKETIIKIDKWINDKLEGLNYKIRILIVGVAFLVGYTIRKIIGG